MQVEKDLSEYDIGVSLTNRCDRGCSLCSFDSKPEGTDFSEEMANKLSSKIRVFSPQINWHISLTGGGEPLLVENLPKICQILSESANSRISLVTSGFLPDNKEERGRIAEIGDLFGPRKEGLPTHDINLSFNDFNKTFPERLKTTLQFILEETLACHIGIKTTLALEVNSFAKALNQLEKILWDMDFPLLKEFEPCLVVVPLTNFRHCYQEKTYSWQRYKELRGFAFLEKVWWHYVDEDGFEKAVLIIPQVLSLSGRAKRLPGALTNLAKIPTCRLFFTSKPVTLWLDEKGFWYPSCCSSLPQLRIGNLDDNLDVILERRQEFAEKMVALLTKKGVFYNCEICSKLAWELAP